MRSYEQEAKTVIELANFCSDKGWLPATSGNLSVRVAQNPLQIAITRSGADKQRLHQSDILLIDEQMNSLGETAYKPSAETSVHIELYRKFGCESIVHVHTVFNNVISELYGEDGFVHVEGHELLKALGHWEEGAAIDIPIVPNWADLNRLGQTVAEAATIDVPAVLVRSHGIYAWGESAQAARRHLEAVEFICEYLYRMKVLQSR